MTSRDRLKAGPMPPTPDDRVTETLNSIPKGYGADAERAVLSGLLNKWEKQDTAAPKPKKDFFGDRGFVLAFTAFLVFALAIILPVVSYKMMDDPWAFLHW